MTATTLRSLSLAFAAACGPNVDGLYRVESYTLNDTSCTGPGPEVARPYSFFKIDDRDFFGVTIYPAYPCDQSGVCATDNDADWSLVVVEDDLDQVFITYTASVGNTCVLSSMDLVIDPSVEGQVVLQSRTLELVLEPYDPAACTTANAEIMHDSMVCAELLQLVGLREADAM